MARSLSQIFRYHCPKCGVSNTCTCKRCGEVYRFDPTLRPGERMVKLHLNLGEDQRRRVTARAKLLGISANEYVRLSLAETLFMPPQRLIS